MTDTIQVGRDLDQSDFASLERCFIPREVAVAACLRRVSDSEARELFGVNGRGGSYSGTVFPFPDPITGRNVTYRLRRDSPDLEQSGERVVERRKYISAAGAGNRVYFPPGQIGPWLDQIKMPILIVQGEKKTLAMWAVAWNGLGDAAEMPHTLPIGLPGVWSWRGRIGKSPAPKGGTQTVKGVIPDLRRMIWRGRGVILLFDSNARTNRDVQEACRQLAGWLEGQGALVSIAELPPEPGISGPDDAAARHGATYILDILETAQRFLSNRPLQVLSPEEEELVRIQPPEGFLGEYIKYASGKLSSVPNDYHVLICLALMAGVLAGKLQTPTRLRPTIAGVIVGIQGTGKTLPTLFARGLTEVIEEEEEAQYNKEIECLRRELYALKKSDKDEQGEEANAIQTKVDRMERAGRPKIIIATQSSVEGLMEALEYEPAGIADYDEFGGLLKDFGREHMRAARENLIKAIDCHPILYRRTRGQSVDVRSPALSLWGTTNVEALRAAAKEDDMFGGLFSRILFCAPDLDFSIPSPKVGDEQLKNGLLAELRSFRSLGDVCVELEDGVEERFLNYGYQIAPFLKGERVNIVEPEDRITSVGYVRYHTHAQKVAHLIAAGEHLARKPKASLHVSIRHALIAISIVERFRQQALRLFRHIERREPVLLDAEKLLQKLRHHPGRERSHYQRMMKSWSAARFNAALVELERSHQVLWEEEKSTGGRTRRTYFPARQGESCESSSC